MSEPRTATGKALLDAWVRFGRTTLDRPLDTVPRIILAIEAEAAALERERLRAALKQVTLTQVFNPPPGTELADHYCYMDWDIEKLLAEPEP